MKKIISVILIVFMILLNSCAGNVNAEVLQKLKTDYPDAKISISGNLIEVVSDNVDTTCVPITRYDSGDPRIYSSAEALLDSMDPETDVIFIGEKTGETKQYIPVNAKTGNVDDLFYTDSKIRVKKVYYGDISEGDIISCREDYAVFYGSEKPKLLYTTNMPVGENEHLYMLHRVDGIESLFGDKHFYHIYSHIGPIDIDIYSKNDFSTSEIRDERTAAEIYNKYVVNNDTALDRDEEIKKNVKYNKMHDAGNADGSSTEKQLEIIDRLIQKYGEKGK